MIENEKLLSIFILSAYDSGYCGAMLGDNKSRHMQLLKNHLRGIGDFPTREVEETVGEVMRSVGSSGIRDYIYGRHLEIIIKGTEEDTGVSFDESMQGQNPAVYVATSCPVHLYRVSRISDQAIQCQNLLLPLKKQLIVQEGLKHPGVGDLVSGHWSYFLETLPSLESLGSYKRELQDYLKRIQNARKK